MYDRNEERVPAIRRLTVRLTAGVILVLLLIGVPFLLAFHRLARNHQIEAMAEATTLVSRTVVDGLRFAMLGEQPHLLDEAVLNLSRQKDVGRVMILDHEGIVRFSSDTSTRGKTMNSVQDSACTICHTEETGVPSSSTAVANEGDRRVLRAMSVIPNEPRCHRCHDPAGRINGILLMDMTLEAADSRFLADIESTVALGTLMVILTVLVLVLLFRRLVHRPLNAVVATARSVGEGDLEARAVVSDPGEFRVLASRLNRMTDHLSRSIREAEAQRHELQEILDAVDDEIIVLDGEQRVVAANRAFRRTIGGPDEQLAGRFCRDVSGSREPCAVEEPAGCPVQRVFRTGRLHKGILTRTDVAGRVRTMEIHASPLAGENGEVSLAVEVRRDISERRQMEASLAQSERLASLGLLASGISHEINNPLAAIATSVEGLRRRLRDGEGIPAHSAESLDRSLARIGREVHRGRAITDRLLRIARPAGRTRTLVDVNHVVEDTVGILSHDIKVSGITIELELGEHLPPLPADEAAIGQMMMNVTLNAIQAMTDGGRLRLATSTRDGIIEIEIEDDGGGIPADQIERIYEPFFTTKPVGKGTGLGLFITHQIVTDMGGSITVQSAPGQGTCFRLTLPRGEGGGRA